jgi:hypothetical protein
MSDSAAESQKYHLSKIRPHGLKASGALRIHAYTRIQAPSKTLAVSSAEQSRRFAFPQPAQDWRGRKPLAVQPGCLTMRM